MADLLFDLEVAPATPSSGQSVLFPETSTKQWASKDANGKVLTLPGLVNSNTADVTANAADTYLTGSSLAIPAHGLQAGAIMRWTLAMTKSAAGTAAPIWAVRVGTLGTTGDTARLTFTQVALQTGVVDTGWVTITAILRNTGASGILAGSLFMGHVLATTGFSTLGENVMQVTSSGFDTTVASTIIGVSVNPGASGVWTHQLVMAELLGT